MACIYLRGKKWWIVYYQNRRKYQRSLKTSDKSVAVYKKNEIENRIAREELPFPDKKQKAFDVFERFKESRRNILTKKTRTTDNYRVERYFTDARIKFLSEITTTSLKKHLDKRIAEDNISNRTANHTIRAINTLINFCIKNDIIDKNPIKYISKYPIHEDEPRYLDSKELDLLLEEAEKTKIYIPIAIAIFTGMRYGEIAQLTWKDIDLDENIIKVLRTKTKKYRYIPIHDRLRAILETQKGKPILDITQSQFGWHFKTLKKKAGLEHFRFHDLRHTFASLLIKSGVDILTVSKLLGHSTISTTSIYTHLYNDHLVGAIKKLAF